MMTIDCDIPPGYSDSLSLPSYSCQLVNGEQRLDYTPRPQAAQSRPNAVYIKNSGELSVLLNDQEENVTIPVFGRRAVISGTVLLGQRRLDSIRKIVLKVEGELDSDSSMNGSQSTKLINNSYTLWSYTMSQCLSQVPFSITLPSTFQDGDNSPALPPSYHYLKKDGLPNQELLVKYQLHFIVSCVRHQKLQDIWPKQQHIIIPFNYVPRTCAMRPVVAAPYFFSSVKTTPEEWHQAITCLEMRRSDVDIGPIFCHLFVPAGRIYGLTDTIKFHIQLTGPSCSLYKLFFGSSDSKNSTVKKKSKNQKPFIHVNLLRQVSVKSYGLNSSDSILGEGTIWPIPPDLSSCGATCRSSQCREDNIDWDGEVHCRSDVTVGGFNVANVQVKDFIILTVSPPTPASPLLMDQKIIVPVKLVTDSFSDDITQMDSGAL